MRQLSSLLTLLILSFSLLFWGCASPGGDSSGSATGSTSGGGGTSGVASALSGAVKTFGSSSSRSGRSAAASSVDVNQGVKSLVSLYLLIDTDFKYPIAKVKSDASGDYEVMPADIKAFLLNPPETGLDTDYGYVLPDAAAITASSTDAEIITAFQSLGPLQVRALYVSNGKAKVISAMADPTSTEPVRVDPIVSRVAQQVIGKLVETIKSTINSISFLSADIKKTLLSSVLDAVKTTVTQTLAEVQDVTTFEVPEGTTFDADNPEAMLEVEMTASDLAEVQGAIESESTTVTIDDTKVAIADTGKLGDTLSDEEKGAFDKLAESASSGATDALNSSEGVTLTTADEAQLKAKAKQVKVDGLRKFFLTLGFPVVLDNKTDNTSVVAVSLKVPPSVADADLPGAATFGDRGIRHFLIKGSSSSTAPTKWANAPELEDQMDALLGDLNDYVSNGVVDEAALKDDGETALIDRVRTFHRFGRALAEGMPLVSTEMVNWMADYDNKTVTVQDVAVQIAKITEWKQERIVFADGLPIFTGRYSAPSTGATVKASELVTALTRPLKTDAKTTVPELTDNNENFWAPFAAQALAEQIMRNANQIGAQNSSFDFDSILPKTKADYQKFLKGVEYTNAAGNSNTVPPSPAYNDARSTVARGLVAALPETAYSTSTQKKTLNGETQLSAKASVFLITYLLELQFPVEKAKGLMSDDGGGLFPNIENFKRLNFTQDVGVAEVAAQVMAVTGPEEGEGFAFAQGQMRSGALLKGASATNGLADLMLPEFKNFDAGDLGISQNATTTVECSVSMFDGSTLPSNLTVSLLKFNGETGEFSAATQTDNTTAISFTRSGDNYTASSVPTGEGYAIKFQIASYRNDPPMIHFWADEYSTTINACGPEGYVIGPDVEFQATPGMGLFAAAQQDDAEGIDFSNYTEPGKMFLLFPSDETNGEGTRDLMLVGEPGGSFSLNAGTDMKLAVLKDNSGSFSLSAGDDVTGIHSTLGESLTAVLGSNFSGADSVDLSPDSYGGLGEQVLLLQVSEKEYWLIELRFLDTEIGMLDLGFAKVSPQGRAEIPEAAFEKGPVDMEKAGSIQNFYLSYGDGLKLNEDGSATVEFAVGFDGTVSQIDSSVTLRYAGDDFLENISSFSDLEEYFDDASSIPVRLDGRGDTSFVKLSFDKQKRSYTMSLDSSSATGLKHNDLIGVCLSGNWDSEGCPDYILRVVRNAPEGDLMANFSLELQAIRFQDPSSGEDPRKAVIGSSSDCPDCPELSMQSSGGTGGGDTGGGDTGGGDTGGGGEGSRVVFDGDFDGVPWLFDPNDEDPNIPGSGGATAGGGGDFGFGLAVHLVNKYTYDGDEGGSIKQKDSADVYSTRLLVETRGVYLGDVEQITLTSAALGMSGTTLATCTPPSMSDTTFTEASCDVTEDTASGLKSTPSLAYQSYEGIGVFLVPTSEALSSLDGNEVNYKITFRKPVDLEGNPFKCGDEDCPGMPPAEGKVKIRVPDTPVGGFENVKIGSGDNSAKAQAKVSSIDSGKRIKISFSAVNNASEYELKVFCAGFENSGQMYFEPPFSMSWMLPRGTTAPSFTIEPGMIPSVGGRSCQFRMIAMGEDGLGNSIGATLHKFDLTLTGGFSGPGGFVDTSLKLNNTDKTHVCWSEEVNRPNAMGTCGDQTTLFSVSIATDTLSVTSQSALVQVGSSLGALGSGDRFEVQASDSQFFEFEVRYVKGGEAKLEFFMPPPRYSIEDGEVKLGGVIWGQVSGTTFTPSDNVTLKDASSQQGVNSIDLSQNGEYQATDSSSGRTIRIMLDIQDSGISLEWFDDFGGGGPTAGGGNLFDRALYENEQLCVNTTEFNFFSSPDGCSGDAVTVFSFSGTGLTLESPWEESTGSEDCAEGSFCVIEAQEGGEPFAKFDVRIGQFDIDNGEVWISVMPPFEGTTGGDHASN
jgi:hypothetical protein